MGATKNWKFDEQQVRMMPGDVFLILSDGVPELFNDRKESFEYGRIKNVFAENAAKTPAEMTDALRQAADKWRNGLECSDDMTIAVIKCKD